MRPSIPATVTPIEQLRGCRHRYSTERAARTAASSPDQTRPIGIVVSIVSESCFRGGLPGRRRRSVGAAVGPRCVSGVVTRPVRRRASLQLDDPGLGLTPRFVGGGDT
jgi:hypothetical protein